MILQEWNHDKCSFSDFLFNRKLELIKPSVISKKTRRECWTVNHIEARFQHVIRITFTGWCTSDTIYK